MTRRKTLAEDVAGRLGAMTPEGRARAIESLQAVIDAQLVADAAEVRCCPHCGSVSIRKHGRDAGGNQRHLCRDCGKTFTPRTKSVMGNSKLPAEAWKRYVGCFVDRLPLRECADRCGVCLKTAFFMRHRIIECLYRLLPSFQVEEGVSAELDETFFRESFKGNHSKGSFELPRPARHRGRSLHKRGISNEQICVMTGVNDYGDMFYEVAKRGPLTEATAQSVLADKVRAGAIISTDKARGYAKVLPGLGVAAHSAYSSKNRREGTINKVNALHSSIGGFMSPFRGVSTRRLAAYLAWFKWTQSFDVSGELALKQVMNGGYQTRWRDYKNAPFLFMGYWERKAA